MSQGIIPFKNKVVSVTWIYNFQYSQNMLILKYVYFMALCHVLPF